MPRFFVTPRKDGRGYTLTGPSLPYGLWYRNEFHALDYAHNCCRQKEVTLVTVVDRTGYPIVSERIEARGRMSAYGF